MPPRRGSKSPPQHASPNRRNAHGRDQFRRRTDDRRRRRDRHDQLAAGQRAVAAGSRRPQARRRGGRGERRGQGDRHHLRGTNLHRRRRHHRIRQAASLAPSPDRARSDRERVEAGCRRAARNRARRGIRSRADGALPHRGPIGEMRPAGDQARPHPRRRRHATPAAPHRRREGARDHSVRNAVRGARGEGMGRRRRTGRGRQASRVGARLRPPPHRRQAPP